MATFHLYLLLLILLSGFPAAFRRNCLLPSTSFAAVEAAETSSPTADGHRRAAAAAATDASLSLLDRVLAAMEMGLGFMEREEAALNLDAIIGTRIVEGQLTVLMLRLKGTEHGLTLPTETVKRIESIRQLADRISTETIPLIKHKQLVYYNRLSAILRRGFWALSYRTREVNSSAVVRPIVNGEAMNEEQSDDCLTELFGTGSGETQKRCRMSFGCWKLMTQPGYRHYTLTHQVFYAEIGASSGCFTGDLRKLTDELSFGFCANILVEAEAIALANFPDHKADLFMEQAALCGILGFREFFRPRWLEAILLWQRHPDGCWGERHSPQSSMRYRREERVLVGGCRCHRTAVALGALVGYVRFLSESASDSRNSPNEYHHRHHHDHYHHHHSHHHHHYRRQ